MLRHASRSTAGAILALALLPAAAMAAKPTITAAPNPITSGDPVVIYGTADPGATVVLWHRINPARVFTVVQRTTADSAGRYEFTRADGVVTTNRNWYVRATGRRSTTVHERVSALVSATGPTDINLVTGTAYTFSGTVSPNHAGQFVYLQRQGAAGNSENWHRIDRGRINADGSFTIQHRFRVPGDANIRVHLRADRRNIASDSDQFSYQISQRQNNVLMIASSVNPLAVGQTTVVSGHLAGVSVPTRVTLYGHVHDRGFSPVATTMTDASGDYAFAPQAPVANTYYQVRGLSKKSAVLFEGVKDVVTATANATSVTAGATVVFSGSVSPDKTGHSVLLERKNADGTGWHVVQRSVVGAGSTVSIRMPSIASTVRSTATSVVSATTHTSSRDSSDSKHLCAPGSPYTCTFGA